MRQEEVARAARVARPWVSHVERGRLGAITVDRLRAIAAALEIRLAVTATWRGADGARVVNERHSRMHELAAARLDRLPGWAYASEVTFSEWGERGMIDILAWHAASRTLLVIELKTEISDPAALIAQVDRHRRLAPQVGRARGWDQRHVACWVLVAESDFSRDQLARHRSMLRNAFPLDGRFLRRWIRDPRLAPRPTADVAALGTTRGDGRGVGGVSGLSFLADVTGANTSGRLGPTKRVRASRGAGRGPHSLANARPSGYRRGNRAAAAGVSTLEAALDTPVSR